MRQCDWPSDGTSEGGSSASEDLGSLSLGGVNGWGNLLFSTVADLQ